MTEFCWQRKKSQIVTAGARVLPIRLGTSAPAAQGRRLCVSLSPPGRACPCCCCCCCYSSSYARLSTVLTTTRQQLQLSIPLHPVSSPEPRRPRLVGEQGRCPRVYRRYPGHRRPLGLLSRLRPRRDVPRRVLPYARTRLLLGRSTRFARYHGAVVPAGAPAAASTTSDPS